jgi:hypothetical protein
LYRGFQTICGGFGVQCVALPSLSLNCLFQRHYSGSEISFCLFFSAELTGQSRQLIRQINLLERELQVGPMRARLELLQFFQEPLNCRRRVPLPLLTAM